MISTRRQAQKAAPHSFANWGLPRTEAENVIKTRKTRLP
ncbi:MAG: hypothetical protein RLY16_320 [Bacteroidota bacterium]